MEWSNWSGSQQHQAERLITPATIDELAALLALARSENKVVRTIGSAHSFVPFWTDDYLVSLDGMRGLITHDSAAGTARFHAGTKLHELGEPLWQVGLSMENMGDIDRQSVAGAISTGTHGTGPTLRSVSNQIVAVQLLTAAGEIREIDESEPELLAAARVSLGSLGIITAVTLEGVPSYWLHERNWQASVEECEAQLESLIHSNRHWEFFWDPQSDLCAMKTLNPCDEPKAHGAEGEQLKDLAEGEFIGRNYEILPSSRELRFNEMEFSVPASEGWPCFMAIREMIRDRYPKLRWPVEYRTLKADETLIGTPSGRETVTISVHEGANRAFEPLFSDCEAIFRQYQGRPHWGKVHSHQATDFEQLYPRFDRFREIRQHFDPEGRFLNPHLRSIFGID
ncbi:MAG: FAD-binding protein [Pseudomonadales bacterium]|nr:FAD-binding protein [Pseudomonadales bacterium]